MNKYLYRDEQWLKKKYINEDLTLKQIGDLCGSGWSVIQKWCKKYHIPLRNPHDPEFMRKIQKRAVEVKSIKSSIFKKRANLLFKFIFPINER